MSFSNSFKELFPTSLSFLIFISYMGLFISQGLLVTASQRDNSSYGYNTTMAVLLSELLKLIVSVILYQFQSPCKSIVMEAKKHARVAWLYFVPSGLYCLYNNLSFINLATFDPTTYFILLQLRVIITAIVFQIIFKKELSRKQWGSLIILTIGCMVKQMDFSPDPLGGSNLNKKLGLFLSFSSLLIFVQLMCSCLAGVYNEYLLKHQGLEVNIYLQNTFMYFDSILLNFLFLFITSDIHSIFNWGTLSAFLNIKVILVVMNNAAVGIVTSFFLKSFNSILKNYASALELIFTAILSLIFFAIPIHMNTVLSLTLIIMATIMYSQNPIKNEQPKSLSPNHKYTNLV